MSVGVGLALAGLTAYAFLAISDRALDEQSYSALGALWVFIFLIGPGFYIPLEQEVGRAISERRALGQGGGPVVRKAARLAVGLGAILVVVSLATSPLLLDRLFDDHTLLFVGFLIGIVGYAALHLVRGAYSGNGQFGAYGGLFGSEGVLRVAGCIALAIIGVDNVGWYGIVMGAAPLLALGVALSRNRDFDQPGPPARYSELSSNLGWLLGASVFTQLLVNCAPLAAKILADDSESHAAGRILNGLLIARIPLFFFQAVQAALLPKLAAQAAEGRHDDFKQGLQRLMIGVIGVGVIGTAAAISIGPTVVEILFGQPELGEELTRTDLGYLAAASAFIMIAVTFAQALIALNGHSRAALGWAVGVLGFVVVTAIGTDVVTRVERGFLAGTCVATVVLGALLSARMRDQMPDSAAPLYEAVSHEFVEP